MARGNERKTAESCILFFVVVHFITHEAKHAWNNVGTRNVVSNGRYIRTKGITKGY